MRKSASFGRRDLHGAPKTRFQRSFATLVPDNENVFAFGDPVGLVARLLGWRFLTFYEE
jgi:hypothetical protein